MTATDVREEARTAPGGDPDRAPASAEERPPASPPPARPDDEAGDGQDVLRPVLAAALATAAAGLVAGGIFGSWPARLTGAAGACGGATWALLSLRSTRTAVMQAAFPFVAVAAGAVALALRGESVGSLPDLVGDAIDAGRLFRPPVPYDPGWTPVLFVLTALIGFAAAWTGAALRRPRLAVAIPLPVVGLTAITQPDDGQFVAGLAAFLPLLAALAVLYGGDPDRAAGLGGRFELRRAVRGLAAAVPVVAALVLLGNASFLFPEPVYDPTEQPQKPRAVPLSAAEDRVLFEVRTDSDLTGPWRAGVLDVYDADDGFWKAPPRRLERLPDDLSLTRVRAEVEQLAVTIVVRDLGDSATMPTLGGATSVRFEGSPPGELRLDTRTQLLRMETGRVPAGTTYTLRLPPYPTAGQLEEAAPGTADDGFEDQVEIPDPPVQVRDLLSTAPDNPWLRLDLLRGRLLANVVASGAGTPVEVTPGRVGELFEEDAKATPYEIVAAEAMLARWAGVPSRVAFGFDGLNVEDGVLTVRPRNSAQWLEVWFDGIGWTPLIGAPQQAESSLDSDPARFDPTIAPSDDVAVDLYLPYELESLEQLYERIRRQVLTWSGPAAALVAAYLAWPYFAKLRRRAKRRRWAASVGPRAQIAVEYAELRDLATDLNVADEYSTPLEYLYEVKDDEEHAELAWLVARTLYGDMAHTVGEEDVLAAEAMATSLRRRLARAQPVQTQVLAMFTRASLRRPYSTEVPNVALVRIPRPALPRVRRGGVRRRARVAGGAS